MNKIRHWSGISSDEIPMSRAMDHQEILELVDGGLIELGSHTRNHLMLPLLSRDRQREEIISGKEDLEALLGRRIDGFAYPNGMMTKEIKAILQDEGFQYSCSSEVNLFRPGRDLYNLPRFWPKEFEGDEFIQYLRRWISL